MALMDVHTQVITGIWNNLPALVLRHASAKTNFEAELYLQSSANQEWLRLSLSVEAVPPHKFNGILFRPTNGPPDPALADLDPEALTGEQRLKIITKVDAIIACTGARVIVLKSSGRSMRSMEKNAPTSQYSCSPQIGPSPARRSLPITSRLASERQSSERRPVVVRTLEKYSTSLLIWASLSRPAKPSIQLRRPTGRVSVSSPT